MARAMTREEEKEARRAARREARREERREERRASRRAERAERRAERGRSRSRSRVAETRTRRSRPTGRWTEEERNQGWIVARNSAWASTGRVKITDKAGFMETGIHWLNWWKDRVARETIPVAERKDFMGKLYDLATSHGHVCGKWMVFAPVDVADDLWADIYAANERGELGGCCKVCAHNKVSDTHLICVYVRDFNDVAECQRVLYNLHNIAANYGVRVIANFKADFLTALGVYKSASSNVACQFTLRELALTKEWPNRRLKRILDNLKRTVRKLEQEQEEQEREQENQHHETSRSRSHSRNHR